MKDNIKDAPRFIAIEEVDRLIEKAVDRVLERVDRIIEEEVTDEEVCRIARRSDYVGR